MGNPKASPGVPPARQLARRLIDRARDEGAASADSAHVAAAAIDRLYRDLAVWVGFDGCHALFTRALAEARGEHPLLRTIALRARSSPYVQGVPETIEQHDNRETARALESMLVILIDLMGRLIGDGMARNLIERGFAESASNVEKGESRRAEA